MELSECEEKGFIRSVTPNEGIITSLQEMAAIKHEEVLKQELTERNISAYLPMYYDAIRELLEAYCLREGYKILNHVCLGEQMNVLNADFDYHLFDRARYIRNGISYYGKRVSLEQGLALLEKLQVMYAWLRAQLN